MTEALEKSAEHTVQEVHDDYRNILHFFVMLAQLESEPEVAMIKSAPESVQSTPERAIEISKVRTRARVNILADAIYATKHFWSKVDQKILRDPESLEAKAYQGLLNARARGDFNKEHQDARIADALQKVPEYEHAQREARHALRRDGEAPHDRVKSYRAAAFILTVLPHLPTNPFAEALTPIEAAPQSSETPSIPRQPVPPLAVDAVA